MSLTRAKDTSRNRFSSFRKGTGFCYALMSHFATAYKAFTQWGREGIPLQMRRAQNASRTPRGLYFQSLIRAKD